jgi:hypothetical protein
LFLLAFLASWWFNLRILLIDSSAVSPIIAVMARNKKPGVRIGKIEIVKTVARRPKGLFRPDKIHRDEKVYSRRRARAELRKEND